MKGEGNSLNYTFRMHDPRVGRFFARDPLASKYPFYSPYAFSGNRVMDRNELEGLEPAPLYWMQYTPAAKSAGITSKVWNSQFTATEAQAATYSGALVKLGFNHYLPEIFIDHYTGLSGNTLILSDKATIDVHASPVSIKAGSETKNRDTEFKNFNKEFNSTKKGESKKISLKVLSKANTQGTLGQFTVIINGVLTRRNDDNSWSFKGTMQFYDLWDFDSKKEGGRTASSESATELGNALLIGKGFKIYSPVYNVSETSESGNLDWFEGKDASSVDTKSNLGGAALKAKECYENCTN